MNAGTENYVYFIRAGQFMKIGISYDPRERLKELQTASPEKLELVGWMLGGPADEKRLHKQFRHVHVRGEWFRAESDLLSFALDRVNGRGVFRDIRARLAQKRIAAVSLGRRGGKVKSPAKAGAARENGKLGGRPPKPKSPIGEVSQCNSDTRNSTAITPREIRIEMSNQEFADWANAKTWGTGNYFEAGRYKLALLETYINNGHKGLRGIAEFVVLESTKTEKDKEPAPVGSRRSAVFVLDGTNADTGKGKLKELVLGLLPPGNAAITDSSKLSAFYGEIYSDAKRVKNEKSGPEKQVARGRFIALDASTASKPTKSTANTANPVFITQMRWGYVPQTKEEYEAERARLTAAGL